MLSLNQINAQIKLLEIWKTINIEKYPIKTNFVTRNNEVALWCNGPVKDRSLCLQADTGTSGRIVDDDAWSSCWISDDAVVADSYSSRSVVTRG